MTDFPDENEGASGDTREQTPDQLLERFEEGEDRALGELIRRETPRVLRRLRGRMPGGLRRRFGESDILQLTAEDLFRLRGRFENHGEAAFRELFQMIASRNLCNTIDKEMADKRSPKRERHAGATETGAPGLAERAAIDSRSPSRLLAREELVRRLQDCYGRLGEEDREIIDLVDHQGLGCSEAARLLKIAPATARKRHSRAIDRLRAAMQQGNSPDESV
jgi:RNA polymerase sigma factor (sigma-70 family)